MCERINLGNGDFAIVCAGRRAAPAKCIFCRTRPHTKLCDGPAEVGKTCDAKICDVCAKNIGVDRDLCPACFMKQRPALTFPATSVQLGAAGYRLEYTRPCKACGVILEFWMRHNKYVPLERLANDREHRRVSHFETCPRADEFRRKKTQMDLFGAEAK